MPDHKRKESFSEPAMFHWLCFWGSIIGFLGKIGEPQETLGNIKEPPPLGPPLNNPTIVDTLPKLTSRPQFMTGLEREISFQLGDFGCPASSFVVSSSPIKLYTLPETNSSPLKTGHPKRKLIFQPSIFRGELF